MSLQHITEPIFWKEAQGDLKSYCESLNGMIRFFAVNYGKQSASMPGGTTYIFFDGTVKCLYLDSDYGNDMYSLDVVRKENQDILPVYNLVDKVDRLVIQLLIPNEDWLDKLRKLKTEYGI